MRADIRLNMQSPAWATPLPEVYAAGLSMARWADQEGFDAIRIGEHHGTDDNWCPSITALAAAVAAVTERLTINLSAVLLPLHDPIHVAEDLAVLDILSRGRLQVVVAAGYNLAEFEMFGVDRAERGRLVEEAIPVLRMAWAGEVFNYRGRPVKVTPRPATLGGPKLILGGSSSAAAKRAVRLGMDYFPLNDEAYQVYQEERRRVGLPPAGAYPRGGPHMLHVTRDVEEAWRTVGPHLLSEASSYAAWSSTDTPASGPVGAHPTSIDELRDGGRYVIATPDEAIEIVRRYTPETIVTVHPLVAGLNPEIGWESLRLFTQYVLPVIRQSNASS